MCRWIGNTDNQVYSLQILSQAFEAIEKACSLDNTKETGGILIGKYSNDFSTAIIHEATYPPDDSRKGDSWFARGIIGLKEVLLKYWQSKDRKYYIGEWHYHPTIHLQPSRTDLNQMYKIRDDNKYCCTEPVLLIVGKSLEEKACPIRAFVFPQSYTYMEFIGPSLIEMTVK